MFAAQALGWLSLVKGGYTHAIAAFERYLAFGQHTDIPSIFPEITVPLGLAYACSGRVTQALLLVKQAMERHQTITETAFSSSLFLHLGQVYLLAGRLDEAISLARQALDLSCERQERGIQANVFRLLGEITARREPHNDEQAKLFYCQALDLANELGLRPLQAGCHRSLGTLYSQIGRLELAHAELTMAIRLYHAMDMTFWLSQAEAGLAQVNRKGEAMNVK